jgi:LacI family transcriptional regulator
MAQIAEDLKLSRAAVSAVINGREKKQRISKKTADLIKEHMRNCGYVQPKSAIQLRKGAPKDLTGVLYCGDFIRYPHLIDAFSFLTKHIKSESGFVEITGVDPVNQLDALKEQVAKGISKLVWLHSNVPDIEKENADALFPLLERMERVVVINYDFRNPDWDKEYLKRGIHLLGYDRRDTYIKTANLLKREGRTHAAMPDFFYGTNEAVHRDHSPVRDIFKSRGIKISGFHPLTDVDDMGFDYSASFGKNLAKLHKEQGVDCAFIRGGILSADIMARLNKLGIKVPQDIAIISFGDMPYFNFLPVPLTTFQIPAERLARKSIEFLEDNKFKSGQLCKLKCKLVLRASHGESAI